LKLGSCGNDDHVGVIGRVAPAKDVTALGDAFPVGAVQYRNALPGQDETDRPATRAARHDGAPRVGRFVRIAGSHHGQVGDRAQRGEVLDRLVGGSVLTEADGVVRPDVDGVDVHQ
jgi:hypothetical protein